MGSKSSKAPSAASVAGAQTTLNDVNQNTPFGSLTYRQTGTVNGVPQMTADVSLSPAQQALYNGQMAQNQNLLGSENSLIGQIDNQAGKGISSQNLQDMFNQQQGAAYNGQMSYLQPQMDQQTQLLGDKLSQQGITQQSNPAAYNQAMQLNSNQQNFAKQLAYNNSYSNGLAGANQYFNQGMQQANLPYNQLSSLRGNSQITMPQFASTPSAANGYANALQNQYGAGLASANNNAQGMWGMAGNLGSAFMNNGGMSWLGSMFGG